MSFSQKKKRSILPIADSFIEEDFILEAQKPRTNKSLLDFKSPKLNRLKNFIKSPVQKSYNKYKQFQDNDDENSSTENKSSVENPNKRQSIDNPNINISNESTINNESKDISQTSLLTTISTVPTDSYPISPCLDSVPILTTSNIDEMLAKNTSFTSKSLKSDCVNAASVSTVPGISEVNFRSSGGSFKESLSKDRQIIRSASIDVISNPKTVDQFNDPEEDVTTDKVDGTNSNIIISSGDSKSFPWNPAYIDVETTRIMLSSLDDHIKNTNEKICKELSVKDEIVDKLITNFSTNSTDSKSSNKLKKEYEIRNKNTEKYLEKLQMEKEQLEFKRLIVNQEGIPWNVNPADHVKNINKKDRNKKKQISEIKQSPGSISKFIKSHTKKSASAENINRLMINENKLAEHQFNKPWPLANKDLNKSKDLNLKSKNLDETSKYPLVSEVTGSPKVNSVIQSLKKPGSAGTNSAVSLDQQYSDKNNMRKKSQSNSMSSGAGKDHENTDNHESPRNHSLSATSYEEVTKMDDNIHSRVVTLQNEVFNLKNEFQAINSEFHQFQCATDLLRLDMGTNSDLNSQKMQNSIENVDRLERLLDVLKQQCQLEFCKWKEDFRNLEEKLDYRLTTSRRDLQDNIDSCNNSISLIEKRTEQLPFISSRTGKSDVKIITDHLCNLIVSLIAFFMLLLSSGFHLLIRFLNVGATICRHRNTLLPLVIIISALVIGSIKWSLWNRFCMFLSDSGYLPNFLTGS